MRTLKRLEAIEEGLREWGQGCVERLSRRELMELRTYCDRIHVERLRYKERYDEGTMAG